MQSVFVYGTLKRNQPNHGVLVPEAPSGGRANFVGMARTMLRYPLVIAGRCHVPYLLDTPGRGEHVLGEVWNVDEAMLVRLDKLENHPVYYQRDAIAVRMLSDVPDGSDAQEKDAEEKTAASYFLRNYKSELDALEMLQNFDANRGEKRYIPIKCRSPGDTLNQTLDVLVAYKP